MNIATAYESTNWATEAQSFINKTTFYTPIIWKAFNKKLAPVIISSTKGLAAHWFESECYWRQRITNLVGITHNPLTASVSAAIAELTSDNAIATYSRIRHIIREAATDALVIGLCGVVAVVSGIELGVKVYRTAKSLYARVDSWLNPAGPVPVILPTVNQCLEYISENDINDVQDNIQSLLQDDIQYGQEFLAKLEQLDEVAYPNGRREYVPVDGEIVNPAPTDMHRENARMVASAAPARDEDELASALEVPGAKGKGTRTSKTKGSTRNAGATTKGKGVKVGQ